MERDRERLRKMTFYCFTNECLRDYILRYFGEYGSNYCGNCSNCLSQFETVDVTDISRILIGCVESSRQRYGTNVMIDTVQVPIQRRYAITDWMRTRIMGNWQRYRPTSCGR